MIGRRVLVITMILFASGAAQAQEDPTVNDSEFDTSAPSEDESYLGDANATTTESSEEPSVSDADFDTSAPEGDTSYLDDGASAGASAGATASATPGLGVWAMLAAIGGIALLARRR